MRNAILGFRLQCAGMAAPVFGQTSNPLSLTACAKLERVAIDEQGNRQIELVDPQPVVPGDRLVLGTRYANDGDTLIENFAVSNPVPAAVTVAVDINPALPISVDGGKA